MNPRRKPVVGLVICVLAIAAIAATTLTRERGEPLLPWSNCIVCGSFTSADVVVNVMLYAPLGVGLALSGVELGPGVLLAFILSLTIEVTQTVLPGRDPSLRDVLTNTMGAGVGMLIVLHARAWLVPKRAATLSFLASVFAATVVVLTAWALSPDLPRGLYYGQWTPHHEDLDHYDGRVLGAVLGGDLQISSGRLSQSNRVRQALLDGERLTVRLVAGHSTRWLAAFVSIACCHGQEIMLLGPDREDLVFRYRTHATALRFYQPSLRWADALGGLAPGDTVDLAVWRDGRETCMSVNSAERCGVGNTIGSGWRILADLEASPPWLETVLDMVWMAALVFPLGVWGRQHPLSYLGVALLMSTIVGLGAFSALRPTPALEWLSGAVGFLLGSAVHRIAAARLGGGPAC